MASLFFQLQGQYAECVNQLIMLGPMNNLERRGSLNKSPIDIYYSKTCALLPHQCTLPAREHSLLNHLNTKYYINNVMGIEMIDASHCSMSYIAVILHHDIALQKYVLEKMVEDLVSIHPGVPTLSKQGPLH